MRSITSISCVAVISTVVLLCGCSKRETERVETPPESASTNAAQPVANAPRTSAPVTSISPLPTNMPALPTPTTSENTAQVATLETTYKNNSEFSSRVDVIYKLSDIGNADALAALGRLFHQEHDNDLRVEILDSLFDIDGLDDKKVALLTAAVAADQVKEVREAAIDALSDIEPQRAIPILQPLLTDPDEEIRDAAKDAIEQLQMQMNEPK